MGVLVGSAIPRDTTFKDKRVTTGSIGATSNVDITVTWDSPFSNTDYTVVAVVEDDNAGESLRVARVRSKTASACVVNVINNAIVSRTGTIHAIARRN